MPARSPELRRRIARSGGLAKNGHAAEAVQVRADIQVDVIAERVRQIVAEFPPLTAEQRARITTILWGGGAA